jgi:DNA-binding CsgD family transcriptional regulator
MSPIICPLAGHHWSSRLPLPRSHVAPPAAIDHASLTPREREIVTLILKGHSSISIAALLSLSPETVKVHRRRIYAKLNISSQAELFRVFLTEHRQADSPALVGD